MHLENGFVMLRGVREVGRLLKEELHTRFGERKFKLYLTAKTLCLLATSMVMYLNNSKKKKSKERNVLVIAVGMWQIKCHRQNVQYHKDCHSPKK